MRLLNFELDDRCYFGIAIGDYAIPFETLRANETQSSALLENMENYLEGLPDCYDLASSLLNKARQLTESGNATLFHPFEQVRILPPPSRPTTLIDFGLTPKHLKNSVMTMLRCQFGPVVGGLVGRILAKRIEKMSQSETPPYCKSNHLAIIGDNDEIGWPDYTSYPDIEPEPDIVVGNQNFSYCQCMVNLDKRKSETPNPD